MAALLSDNPADRRKVTESFATKNPSRSELAMRGLWPPSGWPLTPKPSEAESPPIASAARPQTGKPRLQVRLRGPLPVLDEPSAGGKRLKRSESNASRPPSAPCGNRSAPTLNGVAGKSSKDRPNSAASMRPASADVSRAASWVIEPALDQVARTGRLPSAISATRLPCDGQAVFKGAGEVPLLQ